MKTIALIAHDKKKSEMLEFVGHRDRERVQAVGAVEGQREDTVVDRVIDGRVGHGDDTEKPTVTGG